MPNRGEFRATADQMLQIIDEMRAIEDAKRNVDVGSAEFVDLARKAADQGRLAFRWTQLQLTMAEESAARVARGEQAPDIHLINVAARPLDRTLALWREAQIRLEIAPLGSAQALEAADAIERLREEYQMGHEATESDLGKPPGVKAI
jgi:hypothetical protein